MDGRVKLPDDARGPGRSVGRQPRIAECTERFNQTIDLCGEHRSPGARRLDRDPSEAFGSRWDHDECVTGQVIGDVRDETEHAYSPPGRARMIAERDAHGATEAAGEYHVDVVAEFEHTGERGQHVQLPLPRADIADHADRAPAGTGGGRRHRRDRRGHAVVDDAWLDDRLESPGRRA